LRGLVLKMSEQARHLFSEATSAYMTMDAPRAAAIDDMDSFLDDLQRQFIQAIFESHAAGRIDLQVAIQLAVVARFYERIGDHAVNIGEKVRFQVTGLPPEHSGAARHRQRAIGDPTPLGGIQRPLEVPPTSE
jgi:phosphate transport system protein